MKSSTIEKLIQITQEEQAILDGNHQVQKDRYSASLQNFKIDSKKMLLGRQYMVVRPNTRFVEFPDHSHDFIEIMYVCSGKIIHRIEGKEIVLNAGDMIFLNQYVKHGIAKAEYEDVGINFLVLPKFFDIPLSMLDKDNPLADFIVNTLRQNSNEPEYLVFRTGNSVYIENLMENIILSYFEGLSCEQVDQTAIGQVSEQMNQATMGLVFLHLIHNMDYLGKESSRSYEDIVANTVLQYIANRYADASLTDLAADLYISLSALSKIIKKSTGTNFVKLLQRKRLQKAAQLLADTDLTIEDIRTAVGYENSSYFYNQFREHFHMSPRDYRLENKGAAQIRG